MQLPKSFEDIGNQYHYNTEHVRFPIYLPL